MGRKKRKWRKRKERQQYYQTSLGRLAAFYNYQEDPDEN